MRPVGTYIPPLSKQGERCDIANDPLLAPGVRGYALPQGDYILIPLIVAEQQGNGDVGRFLDSLDPRCIVPSVTSSRLRGMLERRGWWTTVHDSPLGWVTFYHHPAGTFLFNMAGVEVQKG